MSESPKRFIFLPDLKAGETLANSYCESMIQAWQLAGYDRVHLPGGRKEFLAAIKARGRTTCIVNFLEHKMISSEGKIHPRGVVSYMKDLVKLHLISKHLIFVRHDIYPHWAVGKSQAIAKKLLDLSEAVAYDKVLVLSPEYTGGFRQVVPHPSYQVEAPGAGGPPSDDLVFLGGFGPYKGLDRLIEAWDRPSKLILAGECRDLVLLDSLKAKARGKNIEFITHRLGDEEASRLVRSCAAMIIPQSRASYIVSGTLYFGLSCGVPVICNGLPHAKRLAADGFPGIFCIDDLPEVNRLDLDAVKAVDRRAIEEATRAHCGMEAITAAINNL